MKKHLFFASLATLALASCSDNEYLGTEEAQHVQNGEIAIAFTSSTARTTRAEHVGVDAAWMLGSHFVVEGTKGSTSVATTTVFDNYNVIYEANTANKTASNTADWEYVGKPVNTYAANRGISAQTMKYWDFSAGQYDFIAYSTGTTDPSNIVYSVDGTLAADKLYVSDITPGTATSAPHGGAYKVQGTKDMLKNFYLADLVTVPNSKFGEEVQIRFRNLSSKVRVALYETVPGYSIKDVEFYESDAATAGTEITNAQLYSSVASIVNKATYTVYFPTVNTTQPTTPGYQASDMNKAHVAVAATDATSILALGAGLDYSNAKTITGTSVNYLGETSATATYVGSTSGKTYYTVLPNEDASALTLRVNYTLVSDDGSKETIKVWGAKAVVPAEYCQWKSNYAYTYIFKISDNTNGATEKLGGAVEGLHPITFDAVVTDSEDGIQETVTTVATPSITTYSPGVQPTANNEYKNNSYIYAMVMQEGTIQKISAEHPVVVYSLDKAATEAEVMDALNMVASNASGTVTGRNGLVLTPQSHDATITSIPGADGNNITITAGDAAVFHPTTAGTYAVVYGVAAGTPTTYNTAVVPANGTDVSSGYYTDFACTTPATGTADGSTVYYQQLTNNNTKYAVKVIKVVE